MQPFTLKTGTEHPIGVGYPDNNHTPSDDPESARKKAMLLDLFIREIDAGIEKPESAGCSLYSRYKALFPTR